MKENLKLLDKKSTYVNYGVKEGTVDTEIYECPCGKSTVEAIFKHVPGYSDNKFSINCKRCKKLYEIDRRNGDRAWDLKVK